MQTLSRSEDDHQNPWTQRSAIAVAAGLALAGCGFAWLAFSHIPDGSTGFIKLIFFLSFAPFVMYTHRCRLHQYDLIDFAVFNVVLLLRDRWRQSLPEGYAGMLGHGQNETTRF